MCKRQLGPSVGYFPTEPEVRLLRRKSHLRKWWQRVLFWYMPRRRFIVLKEFKFVRPNGEVITAPTDIVIDGASIPVCFYRLIGPPWGDYAEASIIHDWLWVLARKGENTYEFANQVFLEGLEALDIEPWRRCLMYWAVTLGAKVEQRRRSKCKKLGD